jgi:uncharacterized protein (DUF58 family)
MIAPTGRAIAFVAVGAPFAVLLGLFRPDLWVAAPVWLALGIALVAFDAMLGARVGKAKLGFAAPGAVGVGDPFAIDVRVSTGGSGVPRAASLAIDVDGRIAELGRMDGPLIAAGDDIAASLPATALRRGIARVASAWIGWTGPLGFARKQRQIALDRDIAVVPSIRAVREEGAKLFARDAQIGQRLNARLGEGSEFESLIRFMPGLDRRAIDWKQSARHTDLLAKQFETERDNRIVLAIDAGRMMSDPVVTADGKAESRLDRAVSAALTLGYVALRLEDRVSLSSFAARPRVSPREYTRIGDFAALRRAATEIDYAAEESNYTLGLASIGASLKRRAMIVVFTEFADAISAELMIRAAERLVSKHLLVFVVTADSELEGLTAKVPASAEDMTGATIAAELLRDRRVVLTRLRRMGAQVVETPPEGMAAGLLATYVRIKRQGMI